MDVWNTWVWWSCVRWMMDEWDVDVMKYLSIVSYTKLFEKQNTE